MPAFFPDRVATTLKRAQKLRRRGKSLEALVLIEVCFNEERDASPIGSPNVTAWVFIVYILLLNECRGTRAGLETFQAFCDLDGFVDTSEVAARLAQRFGRNRNTLVCLVCCYAGMLASLGDSARALTHLEAFSGKPGRRYDVHSDLSDDLSRCLYNLEHDLACRYIGMTTTCLALLGRHGDGLNLFASFLKRPRRKHRPREAENDELVDRLVLETGQLLPAARISLLMPLFWCLDQLGFQRSATTCFEKTLGLTKEDFFLPRVLSCHLATHFEGWPMTMTQGFLRKVSNTLFQTGKCRQSIALMTANGL
jgi:hypothetical protein